MKLKMFDVSFEKFKNLFVMSSNYLKSMFEKGKNDMKRSSKLWLTFKRICIYVLDDAYIILYRQVGIGIH